MRRPRQRKGFTLIEVIGCTVMMSLIVIAVVAISLAIDGMRVSTRNSVYMSVHNLNCMERVRQMCLDENQSVLLYYGDEVMGSDTIETDVTLEPATWDHFTVYSVTVNSKMRDGKQRLTSTYLITDIGGVSYTEEINPVS